MLDRIVDLREDVIAYLEKDGVKYTEKIVDMIVNEFGENIEDYEKRKNYTVGRTSIAYEKLLVRAIKEVFKENKHVVFEDDDSIIRINGRYSGINSSEVYVKKL